PLLVVRADDFACLARAVLHPVARPHGTTTVDQASSTRLSCSSMSARMARDSVVNFPSIWKPSMRSSAVWYTSMVVPCSWDHQPWLIPEGLEVRQAYVSSGVAAARS